MKAYMLKNVFEGLNARSKVYSPKEYFCKMYPTCVSSKGKVQKKKHKKTNKC